MNAVRMARHLQRQEAARKEARLRPDSAPSANQITDFFEFHVRSRTAAVISSVLIQPILH